MFRRLALKLVFRALLLLTAVCLFFVDRETLNFTTILQQGFSGGLLWVVWLALVVEMMNRLIPNDRIALGARKHFACSYSAAPSARVDPDAIAKPLKQLNKGAFLCALGWFLISAAILFALFLLGLLAPQTVLILILVYAVGDLVFILFYCPFRTLFMHNRCCTVCRIYNWDYFMMCAPLIVFPSFFSVSLFLVSVAVLLRWESALRSRPHYFLKETNENLSCKSCEDKLCRPRKK